MENKIKPEPIWELTSDEYETIVDSVGKPDELEEIIIFFMPGEYGFLFNSENSFDKGVIAINDAHNFLNDAYWYLIHALCFIKYLKDANEKVVISRKYLEPSYLAIYSSLECLATAIEILLAIDINKYKYKKAGISLFSKVGYVLRKDFQDLEITKVSRQLFDNENIRKIVDFRHRWIHNQRIQLKDEAMPIIREHPFWKKGDNFHQYLIGLERGSHHYDIGEYSNIIRLAFNVYFEYFKAVLLFFKDYVCNKGRINFAVERKIADDDKTCFKTKTNIKV